MNKAFLLILSFIPSIVFAQETKKVHDRENQEIFYVLKSDRQTRHGAYKKFGFKNQLLVRGYYKHGVRDSVWECYDHKEELSLSYDFKKNEVVFYKPNDKVTYRRITRQNGVSADDTSLSRPPIFLGGEGMVSSVLVKNLRYPQSALENGISGRVNVSFTVDKSGNTSNYHVKQPLGHGLDEEAIRVFKLINYDWMPGLYNGVPVEVEVMYPIVFRLE